ncbi:ABC transporter transmembrane region 2-domain-containing protein [Entophlyctis helioformis]|nr:ABC transporter transmembrane region 2-domain-containing protein [Entophlyctis helioformis]
MLSTLLADKRRSLLALGTATAAAGGARFLVLLLARRAKAAKAAKAARIDKRVVKVAVDARFWRQLKYILKICVPRWRSSSIIILSLHTFFLILRTYLTVIVARIDGRLVKDMVAADGRSFLKSLIYFMAISIPATYTNSMIRYLQSKLAIALRSKLTNHVQALYMSNNTYYKAINLDNRIDGADQLITTDINRFCTALANLYSNLGKPVLDIIIFNYQLTRTIGFTGMWGLMVNYVVTATILRAITPPFGKMAAEQAKLEGDFRSAHSRLITNAEEIAFYNGEDLEKSILDKTYSRLIKHINGIYRIRIAYNMFEDFIIKYSWSAVGLIIASIPVFFPDVAGDRTKRLEAAIALQESQGSAAAPIDDDGEGLGAGVSSAVSAATDLLVGAATENAAPTIDRKTGSRTQGFITNKRLMLSLADAGGRIMYSYKELSELAGYTYRVYNMLRVLEDLSKDKFVRPESTAEPSFTIEHREGKIVYDDNVIRFTDTPIVTPYGDTILVNNLSVDIPAGNHLMITGPNGAGKTSILRVLSGLWPHFAGTISRPAPKLSSIMYLPQRPYLAIGSLRDQIIYPHSHADMIKAGRTDAELTDILKTVYLDYIPGREGGWEAVKEWKDVFSGGEKQRVQLARLFYHRPRFAVLDEATSAVSTDVEALLYTSAKEAGMTLVTISHRPSLFKYHTYLLRIGETDETTGSHAAWVVEQIGTAESLSLSMEHEVHKLETQMMGMDGLRSRLTEINRELSLDGRGDDKDGDEADDGDLKHAKRTLI